MCLDDFQFFYLNFHHLYAYQNMKMMLCDDNLFFLDPNNFTDKIYQLLRQYIKDTMMDIRLPLNKSFIGDKLRSLSYLSKLSK